MNEKDFFGAVDVVEISIEEITDLKVDADEERLKDFEVFRIDEIVPRRWTGVSSCGTQERVNAEARAALEGWAKNKIFQYRDLRYIRYGTPGGTANSWYNGGGGFGGSGRTCTGVISLPCYIEFRR